MLVCTNCGSSETESDPGRGDVVCMQCGYVLDDNLIIADITYTDNAQAQSSVIGQFVSSEGVRNETHCSETA